MRVCTNDDVNQAKLKISKDEVLATTRHPGCEIVDQDLLALLGACSAPASEEIRHAAVR